MRQEFSWCHGTFKIHPETFALDMLRRIPKTPFQCDLGVFFWEPYPATPVRQCKCRKTVENADLMQSCASRSIKPAAGMKVRAFKMMACLRCAIAWCCIAEPNPDCGWHHLRAWQRQRRSDSSHSCSTSLEGPLHSVWRLSRPEASHRRAWDRRAWDIVPADSQSQQECRYEEGVLHDAASRLLAVNSWQPGEGRAPLIVSQWKSRERMPQS
ncbi:hypothetical protein GGR56DRAFT_545637 [Xylariaceae sp. FL0804]|nr:hypothetical protein GGR56DRAFT_545637 [Xylariaceae sp. FL0804]